jgi:hypothetical protein
VPQVRAFLPVARRPASRVTTGRLLFHHARRAPRFAEPSMGAHSQGGAMAGQGSSGNVIAALASFFVPGLGQLLQGRLLIAIFMFVGAAVLWFLLLGWIVHLWSVLDAALWKGKKQG